MNEVTITKADVEMIESRQEHSEVDEAVKWLMAKIGKTNARMMRTPGDVLAEYELIQQKKSAMSVRGRQYVVNFVERVLPQLKADL